MKYIDADKLIAVLERQNADKKVIEPVIRIIASLQQEQPDLLSGEDVMTMCNQILIDWVKEGKTQEEIEQREQAHSRFFELYDDYLMQEQPEADLDREIIKYKVPFEDEREYLNETTLDAIARHFYELGLNAKKEE